MTDDRTLLERAAKAAGIEVVRSRLDDPACRDFLISNSQRNIGQKFGQWNPLKDDGDALRLAIALGLVVDCSRPSAGPPFYSHTCAEVGMADTAAATRRAIVRAAAQMGE